jgi:amidase
LTSTQAKSAKDLVALVDILLSPTNKEFSTGLPKASFKIREDWAGLRIGFTEPTIWKSWRKSGRINADAERFMVSLFMVPFFLFPVTWV